MIKRKIFFCIIVFYAEKKILTTAGGTRENIDPVRYIGNYSSGKMGLALADCAYKFGAEVTLISTFDVQKNYKVIKVDSAAQMSETVEREFVDCDSLIMAAAVSDFRVKEQASEKIKKENVDSLVLELIKNPDILANVSSKKSEKQLVVGFCAETNDLIENAKLKISKKQCDFIVANDVSRSDTGFGSDYNEVTLF